MDQKPVSRELNETRTFPKSFHPDDSLRRIGRETWLCGAHLPKADCRNAKPSDSILMVCQHQPRLGHWKLEGHQVAGHPTGRAYPGAIADSAGRGRPRRAVHQGEVMRSTNL